MTFYCSRLVGRQFKPTKNESYQYTNSTKRQPILKREVREKSGLILGLWYHDKMTARLSALRSAIAIQKVVSTHEITSSNIAKSFKTPFDVLPAIPSALFTSDRCCSPGGTLPDDITLPMIRTTCTFRRLKF